MKVRIEYMLIIVAWVSLLVAPVQAVAQDSPDIEVSDLKWSIDVNKKHRLRGYYAARSPAPSPDFVQEVSAVFRNVGTKPVTFVTWEYVVYEDSDTRKLLRVYKFRSKATLHPGESTRLSKQGFNIQHRRRVEARVARVEYADGTVWQRAKS